MNVRSLVAATRTRAVVACLSTGALLIGALPASGQWRTAHGNSANTGFARVDTLPAQTPLTRIVGPIAPGANPVIGPDGTVYVANLRGEMRAYYPDGTERWVREIDPQYGGFLASPVVASDGTVYAFSTIQHADTKTNESFLHKFWPGAAWTVLGAIPKSPYYPFTDGGAAVAPPNIWRSNGIEVIMVPVIYRGGDRSGLSVLAVNTNGNLLGNLRLTTDVAEITGGAGDWFDTCLASFPIIGVLFCGVQALTGVHLGVEFTPPSPEFGLASAGFPLPSVAIRPDFTGGPPLVIVTAGKDHDKKRAIVALAFSTEMGFTELARFTSTTDTFVTPPVVKANGDTIVGTAEGRLVTLGPAFTPVSAKTGLGPLTASPTLPYDGSTFLISRLGKITDLLPFGGTIQFTPGGQSIAPAAASCTHIFVSTTENFFTFNAKTMKQEAALEWAGGGLSAPVIGPQGHVYVIAQDVLLTYPKPHNGGVVVGTACDTLTPPQ